MYSNQIYQVMNLLNYILEIKRLYIILDVFHFDISGIDVNELHSLNINSIYITLLIFHLDISGNDINDSHP